MLKLALESIARRSDNDEPKKKEVDTITVPQWPKIEQFRGWVTQLIRNVGASGGRADDAHVAWINHIRNKEQSFDSLDLVDPKWLTLDRKLAKAVTDIMPEELLTRVANKEQ